MGNGFDLHFFEKFQHGFDVNFRRRQKRFAEGLSAKLFEGRLDVGVFDVEHLSHEGKSVGVHAARRQRDDDVPCLHGLVVEDLRLIDHADGKSRKVVFVYGIKTRHFRRFAADEGAARLHATFRHALDDVRHLFGHVLTHGDIVEEKQRFRAAADDVVDAHRHAVDAHGVVLVHEERDLQFGSHAVRAADQHGIFHARKIERKQSAEPAYVAHHAFGDGARDMAFHQFDRFIARGDVHARGFVAFAVTLFHIYSFSLILRSNLFLNTFSGTSVGYFPSKHAVQNPLLPSPAR